MRTLLRYWHSVPLGILATFAAAAPALAGIAEDQKSVFGAMLPIFIAVVTVASVVVFLKQRDARAVFKSVVIGGVTFVISLFLVDIL